MLRFLRESFAEYQPFFDDAGNLVLRVPGQGEPILWSAHTDVVEPCRLLDPIVADGWIRNRVPNVLGLDNKAAIAAFREAILVLKESGTPHRPIEIVFTTQEETLMRGSRNFSADTVSAREGVLIDAASPIGTIITQSPYSYDLTWSVSGPTGHIKTLSPDKQYAWQALAEIIARAPFGAMSEATSINWAMVEGGYGRNTITDSFVLKGDLRSTSVAEIEQFLAQERALLERLRDEYPALSISESHTETGPGYSVERDDAWLSKISDGFTAIGIQPTYQTSFGISDANWLRLKGVNVINLGYGALDTHTATERMRLSDLEKMTEFLVTIAQL